MDRPAVVVEHEVLEDYGPDGELGAPVPHQVLDVAVHHGEPRALGVVPVLGESGVWGRDGREMGTFMAMRM